MSQGQKGDNYQQGESQAFDVNSIEVELLIICKNPAAFQQSASYLSRRGWPTTVIGNLSKAIDHIVKNNPDFILISSNHPNPGVLRLPSLLAQSMNTNCVGFAEQSDAASSARLLNMPFRYKLQGLPSGPNIQRMIRKILIEIYSPQDATVDSTPDSEPGFTADQVMARASGSGGDVPHAGDRPSGSGDTKERGKGSGYYKFSGSEPVGTSELISSQQAMGAEDTRAAGFDETSDVIDGGAYRIGRLRERKRLKDLLARATGWQQVGQLEVNKKALLELAAVAEKEGLAKGESGMIFLPTKPESLPNELMALAEGVGPGEMYSALQTGQSVMQNSALQPGPESNGFSARQTGPQANSFYATQSETEANHHNLKQSPTRQDLGQNHPSGPAIQNSRKPQAILVNRATRGQGRYQGILEKSIETALERVCISHRDQTPNELKVASVVGIVPVDSADLHGYLVVCIADLPAEKYLKTLQALRGELGVILRENGIQSQLEEPFAVSLEEFHFFEWAESEAELGFKTSHEGNEVGVCFIATEGRLPAPHEAEKPDMARISVGEIETDRPIPFKAYLHFKRSDRYYLYLRNGRRLYQAQKERLLGREVKDFYIKSVDIVNYKTYSAANYISRTITQRGRGRRKTPTAS